MKLIYIKSTITPKNYSIVREILKKEQGEKIAPYVYKLSNLTSLEKYLEKERINYEVYRQELKVRPRKGKCKKCNVDLVVFNENCQELEHKREMKYMAITTPECMRPPKKENCWETETKPWLEKEVLAKEKSVRERLMEDITQDLFLAGDNVPCLDCRDKTLALFKEWKQNG